MWGNSPRDKYGFMYDADLEEINKQYEEKYDSINKERLKVWNKVSFSFFLIILFN